MLDVELRLSIQVKGTDDYEDALSALKEAIIETFEEVSEQLSYSELQCILTDVEEIA